MNNLRTKLLSAAALAAIVLLTGRPAAEQAKPAANAPVFKVDPAWPQEMPNHWIMGAVTGVFVDAKQHVWVAHLPETLTEEELYEEPWNVGPASSLAKPKPVQLGTCCKAAPPDPGIRSAGQARPGLGPGLVYRLLRLAARSARHLRRSPGQRLGRQPQPSSRDEVHAPRQAAAADRRVRKGRRQRRHQAARRAVGHLGRSEDERSVHLRRLSQPPRHRRRRRHRRLQAALGRVRQGAGRHREVRSEDDDERRAAEPVLDAARHHRIERTARSTSPIAAATASRCSISRASTSPRK